MKAKGSRPFFIVEASENSVKVVRGTGSGPTIEFDAFRLLPLSPTGQPGLEEGLIAALRELGYTRGPVIFSLPRHQATLRHLKIPAASEQEVGQMVGFQAPRHIPYPPEDIITAYEVVRRDEAGFSHVNLVIAHRDVIAPYLKVCQTLGLSRPIILLSSFGLCRVFGAMKPEEKGPAIVLEINDRQIEFAISYSGTLAFSRSLRFDSAQAGWPLRLSEELTRTLDAYVREVGFERPSTVFLMGRKELSRALFEFLAPRSTLRVQEVSPNGHIRIAEDARPDFERSASFYSLVGLALAQPGNSLLLLPAALKDSLRQKTASLELLRTAGIFVGAVFLFIVSLMLNVHNKSVYLGRLKQELDGVKAEAGALEEIDRRVALLRKGPGKTAGLGFLYDLHQCVPEGTTLSAFEYDSAGKVTLRGQSAKLDGVFTLAQKAEAADAFHGYSVAVRYATARKTSQGDVIDFEIVANRR